MNEKLPKACKTDLNKAAEDLSIELSEQQQLALLDYLSLLIKWNKAYNLTAVRDPLAMTHRHLIDALSIVPLVPENRLIDVGTGAGIPGIILAILRPQQEITLLDSNGKKTRFLQQVKMQMKLDNVEVLQSRVEGYSPSPLFDTIVSRAFTALDNMVNLTQHLSSKSGKILAMKGTYPEPNQQPLPQPWVVQNVQPLVVPFVDEQRHLVTIGRN